MPIHPIEPVFDEKSEILILGSFPSVKSREGLFFYGHPQNRFWRVLAEVYYAETPKTVDEKKNFLLAHKIALWDVIASCDIVGSSDSSIKNVIPNDLNKILNCANIKRIFVNGKTSEKYYNKYIHDNLNIDAVCLPSTSPANASWSFEHLVDAWKAIKI